jgi:hypothetical protein
MLRSISNETSEYFVTSNGGAKDYKITGSDTDCDESIDFLSLLDMVTHVIDTGSLPDQIEFPGNPGLILGASTAPTAASIRHEHDLTPYEDIIKELRKYVAKKVRSHAATNVRRNQLGMFIQLPAINGYAPNEFHDEDPTNIKKMLPVICFVEGFLLFTDPIGPTHDDQKLKIFRELPATYDIKTEQVNMRTLYQLIAALTRKLEVNQTEDNIAFEAREKVEEEVWGRCIQAKYLLQSKFDAKIFLSTSQNTAMKRRLSHPNYIDYPEGQRLPGQMWKTYGYLENVAWKNHMDEHNWLTEGPTVSPDEECCFEKADEWKGIHILRKLDAGVEEILRWAVDAVLHSLFEGDFENFAAGADSEAS